MESPLCCKEDISYNKCCFSTKNDLFFDKFLLTVSTSCRQFITCKSIFGQIPFWKKLNTIFKQTHSLLQWCCEGAYTLILSGLSSLTRLRSGCSPKSICGHLTQLLPFLKAFWGQKTMKPVFLKIEKFALILYLMGVYNCKKPFSIKFLDFSEVGEYV